MIARSLRALGFLLALAPGLAHADPALTLDDAIRLAFTNNERARKAPLRVDAADGTLERARGAFLPTLVGTGSGAVKGPADRNGRIGSGQAALTLTQPLLNLSAFPLYAQARRQLDSERWGAIEDKRQLAFDTAHAFLVAAASEHLVAVAKAGLDRARANEADTQARAEAGLSSSNDVTRTLVASGSAETQLVQAKGNLEKAYLQLAFLIGAPVTGPLASPEKMASAAQRDSFRTDDMLRFAEARRPDVRSAHEHTEALRESAREPNYRLVPTVNIAGQVHAVVDPAPTDIPRDESVTLNLTWTLFDSGLRYGDRRTREAQADSGALDESLLRRSIATDVALALSALASAREIYRVSDQAVANAKRDTEETAILYKQGLARAIELTDSNATRYAAEVNLESAALSMEQAYLQLRQAIGLEPTGDPIPRGPSTEGERP